MFILEGRDISLCRIACTLLFVSKLSSKHCLSCLCLTRSCFFAVQLRGALALSGSLASLGLLVLWCGGLPVWVQQLAWTQDSKKYANTTSFVVTAVTTNLVVTVLLL